ncbi:MAG: MEKHLA domain-containing protein [Chthoniobacterales bacterium]|nr:MEKHLA domain-containing protein [Chthoniobacterales bacterium]
MVHRRDDGAVLPLEPPALPLRLEKRGGMAGSVAGRRLARDAFRSAHIHPAPPRHQIAAARNPQSRGFRSAGNDAGASARRDAKPRPDAPRRRSGNPFRFYEGGGTTRMSTPLPIPRGQIEETTALILRSYRHWFMADLVAMDHPSDAVGALFDAPRIVLSALGPFGTDHTFNYANRAALELFETTWDGLIGQPSSKSAEPVHRDERRRLLEEVRSRGFIENYSGVRISSEGRRFRIKQATVFNLLDEAGAYIGQAATFADWEPLA